MECLDIRHCDRHSIMEFDFVKLGFCKVLKDIPDFDH